MKNWRFVVTMIVVFSFLLASCSPATRTVEADAGYLYQIVEPEGDNWKVSFKYAEEDFELTYAIGAEVDLELVPNGTRLSEILFLADERLTEISKNAAKESVGALHVVINIDTVDDANDYQMDYMLGTGQ
jgi:hypothetical protein